MAIETLIFLSSVGTYLDPITTITYGCSQDGEPDLDSPINLSRVSNGWIACLSVADYLKIIAI